MTETNDITLRGSRLTFNVWIKGAAEFYSRSLQLFLLLVAARVLGPDSYGYYSYAYASLFVLGRMTSFGLGVYLCREVAGRSDHGVELIAAGLRLKMVFSFLGLLLLAMLVLSLDLSETFMIFLLAVGLMMNTGVELICNVFRGLQRLSYEAAVVALGSSVTVGLGCTAVLLGFGIVGLAGALAVSSAVSLAAASTGLYMLIPDGQWWQARVPFTPLLRPLFPFFLLTLLDVLYAQIDLVVVGYWGSATDVGYLAVCLKLTTGCMLLPLVIMAAVFPAYVAADRARRRLLARRTFATLAVAATVLAAVLAFTAAPILEFAFGSAYLPGVPYLRMLAIALLFWFPNDAVGSFIISEHGQQPLVLCGIGLLIASVLADALLIPRFGALAAVYVRLFEALLSFAFRVVLWSFLACRNVHASVEGDIV